MTNVLIRGQGIAACCCARLLRAAGSQVTCQSVERPKLPALMLSQTGQKLLSDVFERRDLFIGVPRIRQRFVAWGRNSNVRELPHSAVVVSEGMLLELIRQDTEEGSQADWTIFTSHPLPAEAEEHQFGARRASVSEVSLTQKAARDACWIESVENGWLFLLPGGDGCGWLLAVGGPAESLLGQSRLIAEQIEPTIRGTGDFPSHPRATEPLCGQDWLACGTAALGFDPLCGDGTAYSAREAILASALIRLVSEGGDRNSLLEHYRTRLLVGLQKHLEVCREFYASGHGGPWWEVQLRATEEGLQWCTSRLGAVPKFRYRLNGFSLEAVE